MVLLFPESYLVVMEVAVGEESGYFAELAQEAQGQEELEPECLQKQVQHVVQTRVAQLVVVEGASGHSGVGEGGEEWDRLPPADEPIWLHLLHLLNHRKSLCDDGSPWWNFLSQKV